MVPTPAILNFSALVSFLDFLSPWINPYSIALNFFDKAQNSFYAEIRSFSYFFIVLIPLHSVLWFMALVSLCMKIFRKDNEGKRRKLWICRRHYTSTTSRAHYVPNGHFIIEFLQLIGCMLILAFSSLAYNFCRDPERAGLGFHSSILFWLVAAFTPGFIGFWLNSWSTFYVVLFSPSAVNLVLPNKNTFILSPLLMNTLCIGIPVIITVFYLAMGIFLSVLHRKLGEDFKLLKIFLTELSDHWEPTVNLTSEQKYALVSILERTFKESNEVFEVARLVAFTWTGCSTLIIAFSSVTTILITKLFKKTERGVSSKEFPLFLHGELKISQNSTHLSCEQTADHTSIGSPATKTAWLDMPPGNVKVLKSLRKSNLLAWANWVTVTMSLGCMGSWGALLGTKITKILFHDDGTATFAMLTASSTMLSFGIFLQTFLSLASS